MSYKHRFILLFLGFGLLIVLGSLGGFYLLESRSVKKDFYANAETIIAVKQERFERFIEAGRDAVLAFARLYAKEPHLQEHLMEMLLSSDSRMIDIALFDAKGHLIKRIAKGDGLTLPKVGDAQTLGYGEVWYSPLASQHDAALMYLQTPLYVGKHLRGYLSITIDATPLLEALERSFIGYVHLVDRDGRFLIYRDELYHGAEDFDLYSVIGESADDVLFADYYVGATMYAKGIEAGTNQSFKLILEMRTDLLTRKQHNIIMLALGIIGVVVLLSIPLAWVFAIIPDRLNRRVVEKSEALAELNQTLERRVEEEVGIRREKERMLVHQSKMAAMGEMIGAIAHQWRQPLNTLGLITISIRDHIKRGNEQGIEEELVQIERQLEFMSGTIDDFRNFFKADKEHIRFDVVRAVQDVVTLLSAQIVKHDIHIGFHFSVGESEGVEIGLDEGEIQGATAFIKGYPNEFKQVILNLVNNAKDAVIENAQEGLILIHVKRLPDKVMLIIEDNGGGIPESILHKVFDPYFSTKGDGGTGVGLEMSKNIIENTFKGEIWVENGEEGARFSLCLEGLLGEDEAFNPNPQNGEEEIPSYETSVETIEPTESLEAMEESSLEHRPYLEGYLTDFTHEEGAEVIPELHRTLDDIEATFELLHEKFPKIKRFHQARLDVQSMREYLDQL